MSLNSAHKFLLNIYTKNIQEVGDNLSVCMIIFLPKVSSLPSLLAINLWKWRYRFFKQSRDIMLVTWSKGHIWEPLTLCQHLTYCDVDTSSAVEDMYFTCHVTQKDHSFEMSCVFMGESSLPHVTKLKVWWP